MLPPTYFTLLSEWTFFFHRIHSGMPAILSLLFLTLTPFVTTNYYATRLKGCTMDERDKKVAKNDWHSMKPKGTYRCNAGFFFFAHFLSQLQVRSYIHSFTDTQMWRQAVVLKIKWVFLFVKHDASLKKCTAKVSQLYTLTQVQLYLLA